MWFQIHQRIAGSGGVTPDDGYNSSSGAASTNPDLAAALPHLAALVESLRSSKLALSPIILAWRFHSLVLKLLSL